MSDHDFMATYPAVTEFFTIPKGPERARAIIAEVTARRSVPVSHLFSTLRDRKVSHTRHEIWFRLRQECAWSYPRIAKFFDKDHTTILYGVRGHEARLAYLASKSASRAEKS